MCIQSVRQKKSYTISTRIYVTQKQDCEPPASFDLQLFGGGVGSYTGRVNISPQLQKNYGSY